MKGLIYEIRKSRMMKEDRIESLLIRYYTGELSADEMAHLDSWMRASAENRKMAEQIYYLCFATDALETCLLYTSPSPRDS